VGVAVVRQPVTDLINLLEQREFLTVRLIELARAETRALLEDDLMALNQLTREQHNCGRQLADLQSDIITLYEEMTPMQDHVGDEQGVDTMVKARLPQEGLTGLLARLRASDAELKGLNELNRRLIEQKVVCFAHALAAWQARRQVYDHQGQVRAVDDRCLVNRSV
jgi:hypothetical protein